MVTCNPVVFALKLQHYESKTGDALPAEKKTWHANRNQEHLPFSGNKLDTATVSVEVHNCQRLQQGINRI